MPPERSFLIVIHRCRTFPGSSVEAAELYPGYIREVSRNVTAREVPGWSGTNYLFRTLRPSFGGIFPSRGAYGLRGRNRRGCRYWNPGRRLWSVHGGGKSRLPEVGQALLFF